MKNQQDLVLRYFLVFLSRFEKIFQTTKSTLTNEKTNYNELQLLNNYKWPPTTSNDYLQQKGNNSQL